MASSERQPTASSVPKAGAEHADERADHELSTEDAAKVQGGNGRFGSGGGSGRNATGRRQG